MEQVANDRLEQHNTRADTVLWGAAAGRGGVELHFEGHLEGEAE